MIVCDLERRRPVTLLPDRKQATSLPDRKQATSLPDRKQATSQAWLADRPCIVIGVAAMMKRSPRPCCTQIRWPTDDTYQTASGKPSAVQSVLHESDKACQSNPSSLRAAIRPHVADESNIYAGPQSTSAMAGQACNARLRASLNQFVDKELPPYLEKPPIKGFTLISVRERPLVEYATMQPLRALVDWR